jgi:replicative DNA helicase
MSAEVISIRGGVPDHDLDAERAVLASVLLDQTALERVPVLGP